MDCWNLVTFGLLRKCHPVLFGRCEALITQNVSNTGHVFRMQVKASELKLMEGMLSDSRTITIGNNWAATSWVYVYIFSDGLNSQRGFGAYVPTNTPPIAEYSESGVFDMANYENTY